jgi:hypothetical protein
MSNSIRVIKWCQLCYKVYLFPSSRLLSRSSVRSSPNHFTTMYLKQRIDVITGLHGVDRICRLLVILLLILEIRIVLGYCSGILRRIRFIMARIDIMLLYVMPITRH